MATILTGLLSFMLETTPTYGSTAASVGERRQLASASLAFNLRNETFCELFPDVVAEIRTKLGITDPSPPNSPSAGRKQKNRPATDHTSSAARNNRRNRRAAAAGADPDAQEPAADSDTVAPILDEGAVGVGGGRFGEADNWQSVCSNVLVLAGFAIFAYVANYVIKNLNAE